ncbi:MAG: peptide chain release factor 2 [Pirellulaceae bacterium]|nr:peptide chain release factor 2 [Pirellulaceae bacterium]
MRFNSAFCSYETVFDYVGKQEVVAGIETRMAALGFWDNQEKAQLAVGQLKSLKTILKPLEETLQSSEDLAGLLEMAAEDEGFATEVASEISRLEKVLGELELAAMLDGPNDAAGALISIYARDGGTDANDWAEMMLRMYTQWAQKNGYSCSLLDRQDDEVAGIQNASIAIRGPMAYGYLKGETGTHRLVRISPFNADGKRQTSFAAVDVSPEVSDDIEIEIDKSDVREDTFRASGAGGQHVNKTSSAIRLTHLPTGTVSQCQSERSQHKNRATAWKMLRARMARAEEEKREAEDAKKYKNKARVGFGSQIRNYFLHPDQRVKDARTGHIVGSFSSVLDGNIQEFLDAYLRWRIGRDDT